MNTDNPDDDPVNLGELANDNPWEVFHKASFGQPGVSNMTAGVTLNWTAQDVADLLSYLQTLSRWNEMICWIMKYDLEQTQQRI